MNVSEQDQLDPEVDGGFELFGEVEEDRGANTEALAAHQGFAGDLEEDTLERGFCHSAFLR